MSASRLREADVETQIKAMRQWFFSNFQDPVEETPFDSEEGGYIFMHGGPYDAQEELDSRFDDIVPDAVREKLVRELENRSVEWEGVARPGDYDDYLLDSIAPPSEHLLRFTASIKAIRKLKATQVDPSVDQMFRRMLFVGVISALETYLSDKFVSSITKNQKALRKFVETFPRFQKETIKVSEVISKTDSLEREVKTILLSEFVWHRLEIVTKMLTDTFGIELQESDALKSLLKAVQIRHAVVHRGGQKKRGEEHLITPEDIDTVITEAEEFVNSIEIQSDKFKPSAAAALDGAGEGILKL